MDALKSLGDAEQIDVLAKRQIALAVEHLRGAVGKKGVSANREIFDALKDSGRRISVTPPDDEEGAPKPVLFSLTPGEHLDGPVVMTGYNAWLGIIAPLQIARIESGVVPADSEAFSVALRMAGNLAAFRAPNGAIYLAPKETTASSGATRIPDRDVSNAQTLVVMAAFGLLIAAAEENGAHEDTAIGSAVDRLRYIIGGIERYFAAVAFNRKKGLFHAGGKFLGDHFSVTTDFSSDVQLYALLEIGARRLDMMFGEGAAFRIWTALRGVAGCFGPEDTGHAVLRGMGLMEGHENAHAECTYDAIAAGTEIARFYESSHPEWANPVSQDVSHLKDTETLNPFCVDGFIREAHRRQKTWWGAELSSKAMAGPTARSRIPGNPFRWIG